MKFLNVFLFLSSLFVVILSSRSDENVSKGSRSSAQNENQNLLLNRLNRMSSNSEPNIQRRLVNTFTNVGFNRDDSLIILNHFNDLRSELANGRVDSFKSAANMQELKWDYALTSVANDRAQKCGIKTDTTKDLLKNFGYTLNSNSYSSMTYKRRPASGWDINYVKDRILLKWWNDKSNSGCSAPKWENCKDFQTLAWAKATAVGCSINTNCASVNNYDVYFTCYFGDVDGSGAPYIEGSVCTECGNGQECNNGLCLQCPTMGPPHVNTFDYSFERIPNSNVDLYTKALIKAIPCVEMIHVTHTNLQVQRKSGKSYDYFSVVLTLPELLERRITSTSFDSYKDTIYAEAIKLSK